MSKRGLSGSIAHLLPGRGAARELTQSDAASSQSDRPGTVLISSSKFASRTAVALLPIVLSGMPVNGAVAADRFPHQDAAPAALVSVNESVSFEVQAKPARWQSSGVTVEPGRRYALQAAGQWQVGPLCQPTGPDGKTPYTLTCWDLGGQLVSGVSHSALIAKVGQTGKPFATGDSMLLSPQETGVLYFMANDIEPWFGDNTGALRVEITALDAAPATPQSAPAPTAGTPSSSPSGGAAPRSDGQPAGGATPVPRRGGGGGGRGGGSGG